MNSTTTPSKSLHHNSARSGRKQKFFWENWKELYAYSICKGDPTRTLFLLEKVPPRTVTHLPDWKEDRGRPIKKWLTDLDNTRIRIVQELPQIKDKRGTTVTHKQAIGVAVEHVTEIACHVHWKENELYFYRKHPERRLQNPTRLPDTDKDLGEEGLGKPWNPRNEVPHPEARTTRELLGLSSVRGIRVGQTASSPAQEHPPRAQPEETQTSPEHEHQETTEREDPEQGPESADPSRPSPTPSEPEVQGRGRDDGAAGRYRSIGSTTNTGKNRPSEADEGDYPTVNREGNASSDEVGENMASGAEKDCVETNAPAEPAEKETEEEAGSDDAGDDVEPQGFIQERLRASKKQRDWVRKAFPYYDPGLFEHEVYDDFEGDLEHLYELGRRLWLHVLISTFTQPARWQGIIPVCADLMRRDLEDCPPKTELVWRWMVEADVLKHNPYRSSLGQSRSFQIPIRLVQGFLEAFDPTDPHGWDLIGDKRSQAKRALATITTNEHSDPYTKEGKGLADRGIRYWNKQTCYFNRDAVKAHLEARKRETAEAFQEWKRSGKEALNPGYEEHLKRYRPEGELSRAEWAGCFRGRRYSKEYARYMQCWSRYRNDYGGYQTIMRQNAQEHNGAIWSFEPAYEMQELTGRISQRRGGLQSVTREMKRAAYVGIVKDDYDVDCADLAGEYGMVPNVRNYDLSSSQSRALQQRLREHGFDTGWLERYHAEGKEAVVERLGIGVGLWKKCCYAVFFSAILHKTLAKAQTAERISGGSYSIAETIRKAHEAGDIDDPHRAYDRVEQELRSIYETLKEWRGYLVGELFKKEKDECRGGDFRINACGIRFFPEDHTKKKPQAEARMRRAKASAHELQGLEAAYIHAITILSAEYDYVVIANEHDGVATIGEIPQEARERTADMSGYTDAVLKLKPFVKGDDFPACWDDSADTVSATTRDRSRTDRPSLPPRRDGTNPTRREAEDADE